jgi:hypothetical protein
MEQTPRYQLHADVADFANRFEQEFNRAVARRMRQVGVPEEMIGTKWWGEGADAFIAGRQPPQVGGSMKIGADGKPGGINIDAAVLDTDAPKMGNIESWRSANLKDRIDAVIAHEHAEFMAPKGVDGHIHALRNAEHTALAISDTAREILKAYRAAEGY